MLGRGKVLIMSDSAYTRTFVWNVSVWRSMYHICTLYIFTAWSVIAVLLSVNYQQEKLKINNFWFPSTWWFPSFLGGGFSSKCWPGKKCHQIHSFWVFKSWPGFGYKMCNFSEFVRTGEVNNTFRLCDREWVTTLSTPFNIHVLHVYVKPRTGDLIKSFISGLL